MEIDPIIEEAATGFRTGQIGLANSRLVSIADALHKRIEEQPPAAAKELMATITAMLSAQQRGDAITVADVLQYELPRLLEF